MCNYSMDLKKIIAKNEKEGYCERNDNYSNIDRVSND